MKIKSIIILTFVCLVIGLVSVVGLITLTTQPPKEVKGVQQLNKNNVAETTPNIEELWLDVNAARKDNGLGPLTIDTRLTTSATAKCADMAANHYWAHVSPTGVAWDSFIQQQYTHYEDAAENIAQGYTNSQKLVNAWMASPGHRANILQANFSQVGYAVCSDRGSILVVQHFVAP